MNVDRDISFIAAAFLLLWSQLRTREVALPLSSVYNVKNTTPLSSCAHLIQNIVLYRRTQKRKKERKKSKERALIEQGEW
jgi:hypothetical protein